MWVVYGANPGEIARAARGTHPGWLAASILPAILRFVVWGRKAGRITRRFTPVDDAPITGDLLAGAFVNLVTPTAKVAGGVYRAAVLRARTGTRFSSAYGWIFADQMTNSTGSLIAFGATAVVATMLDPDAPGALLVGGVAALVGVVAFVFARPFIWRLAAHPAWRRRFERLRPRREGTPRTGHDTPPEDATSGPERWLGPSLSGREGLAAYAGDLARATAVWGWLCLSNWLVFRAMGVEASPWTLSSLLVLGTYAGGIFGMGGLGVTEAALIKLYGQVGVGVPEATIAALLHRAGYYGVVVVWGGVAFLGRSRMLAEFRIQRARPRNPPDPP